MVKNLPANAGDIGLIPGPGTNIPLATGHLSLCSTIIEANAMRSLHKASRDEPPLFISSKLLSAAMKM